MKNTFRKDYYSWEGEDALFSRILDNEYSNIRKGFYVDVGAHHPHRLSNTNLLFERGWNGINLDAMPGSMTPFVMERPDDISLELAVGTEGTLDFYVFDDPVLNGFLDADTLQEHLDRGVKLLETKKIKVRPLSSILDEYLPKGQPIALLNVDAETKDLDVLMSNDWNKYRPKFIMVEVFDFNFDKPYNSKICKFLKSKGYKIRSKLYASMLFERDDEPQTKAFFKRLFSAMGD